MEKRNPTYDSKLSSLRSGLWKNSQSPSARSGDATALGFEPINIVETIQSITKKMFFKSMTTYADHTLWQDVYHVPIDEITLYIKFQAHRITEFRVMSFKEK